MELQNRFENLRRFLQSPHKELFQDSIHIPCGLAKHKDICQCKGTGYQMYVDGAYSKARLCQCVLRCSACAGNARRLEGSDSKECTTPSPCKIVAAYNAAMIPARYSHASLENFTNFAGNGRNIIQQLRGWSDNFKPTGSPGIILSGPVGVGKTHLLVALAKSFVQKGFSVCFTDFFQLLAQLRSGFSEGKADSTQLAPLISVDILIIDELGKGRNRDFDRTVLDQLVCGRYNQNKTIIASTNFLVKGNQKAYNIDLEQQHARSEFAPDKFGTLENRIGSRIFSRLRETTSLLELSGEDMRQRTLY